MITLQLQNITFSTMGLETDIDLEKVTMTRYLISQSHRTEQVNKLRTFTLMYPERQRGKWKER